MSQELTETYCELGYICANESIAECANITISECSLCSSERVVVVCFFLALIGFVGLILNSIVAASVLTLESNMRTSFSYVKLSLAFTDMLWGIFIYLVIVPNVAHTLSSTRGDFELFVSESPNSWQAILGTLLFYILVTASIYHLMFFALTRVGSIKFAHWFRIHGKKFTSRGLIAVWATSFTIPAILVILDVATSTTGIGPKYIASRFLYDTTTSGFIFYFGTSLLAIIPIGVMTICTIYTGVLVRRCMRHFNNENGENQSRINRQNSIFRTLILLEVAFVVGITPLVIYYATMEVLVANFPCSTVATYSIVSFFMGTINSIVDPLIYSFRDDEFRASSKRMFKKVRSTSSTIFTS